MARSVEEKVEEYYKNYLKELGIRYFNKTEGINKDIDDALKNSKSKSGGTGLNYPDIKLLLENNNLRRIPVMMEAKGGKNKLEKLKDGEIIQTTIFASNSKEGAKNPHKKGDLNFSTIKNFAVNGALHYGNAILSGSNFDEVLVIGLNGTTVKNGKLIDPEAIAYYVSRKNNFVPKHLAELDKKWDLLKKTNIDKLYSILDRLVLSDEELEKITLKTEADLEKQIKAIHQTIYDDKNLKTILTTNEKLYLFSGLIMAGLKTDGAPRLQVSELNSNILENLNDGHIILNHIEAFLQAKKAENKKIEMIMDLLNPIFKKKGLNAPINGESLIKSIYNDILKNIIPLLESNLHLDFTGKILNSLNDWISIDNDKKNDVVLTPRYVTNLMAKLARTNKDSFVWDITMGSAGFLVSAMDIMIRDAKQVIQDEEELDEKIKHIKGKQILGIEVLGQIYLLAVINMILMGDGSSNMIIGDSHTLYENQNFPANVFLLNPPYSADGKGFNFVEEALSKMQKGYAAILIQENAGSGAGLPFTKKILKKNTLEASIHMPKDLFIGKSNVQTSIYVFKVNEPHNEKKAVTFIDFSNDGYTRTARKKSSQEVNLRNKDHAKKRYQEVLDLVLGNVPDTQYYTEQNKKVIRAKISLNGDDWTFSQHLDLDLTPSEDDFKKTVSEYLTFEVSNILKGNQNYPKE